MLLNRKTFTALMLLAITTAFSTISIADGNSSRAAPSKFVGTFYGGKGKTITHHADGTMSLVDANMFSDDPVLATGGRRSTPFQGVWRKVGKNSIQVTSLSFVTEIAGHRYLPDGFIVKVSWLATFDDPVKGISPGYTSTNVVSEIFYPTQNPITDDPILIVDQPDGRGYRLIAE